MRKGKSSIKKEFDSEPVYNEIYLRTKIEYYKGKINTSFHSNKTLKEGSPCICLAVLLIDFGLEQVKTIILKYF